LAQKLLQNEEDDDLDMDEEEMDGPLSHQLMKIQLPPDMQTADL